MFGDEDGKLRNVCTYGTFYCRTLPLRTNNSLPSSHICLFPTKIDRRTFAILIARETIIHNFELGIYCIYPPLPSTPRLPAPASRAQTQNNCHTPPDVYDRRV